MKIIFPENFEGTSFKNVSSFEIVKSSLLKKIILKDICNLPIYEIKSLILFNYLKAIANFLFLKRRSGTRLCLRSITRFS